SGAPLEQPREMVRAHVHQAAELREAKLPVQIVLDVLRHPSEPALGQPSGRLIGNNRHRKTLQARLAITLQRLAGLRGRRPVASGETAGRGARVTSRWGRCDPGTNALRLAIDHRHSTRCYMIAKSAEYS